MTSPNREKAETEAGYAIGRQWLVGTKGIEKLVADKLEAAYDALSTALADRDRYKDALAASEVRNFELAANQCEAGYGDDGGSHRCRYQDELADVRNSTIKEVAAHLAERAGWSEITVHLLTERILALLTQPDRSAARQKVIEFEAGIVEAATRWACAPTQDAETTAMADIHFAVVHRNFAVQELQSPNKEEGGK